MDIMQEEKMRALKELAKKMYALMVQEEGESDQMEDAKEEISKISNVIDEPQRDEEMEDDLDLEDMADFMRGPKRMGDKPGAATVAIEAIAAKPVSKKPRGRRGRKKATA